MHASVTTLLISSHLYLFEREIFANPHKPHIVKKLSPCIHFSIFAAESIKLSSYTNARAIISKISRFALRVETFGAL